MSKWGSLAWAGPSSCPRPSLNSKMNPRLLAFSSFSSLGKALEMAGAIGSTIISLFEAFCGRERLMVASRRSALASGAAASSFRGLEREAWAAQGERVAAEWLSTLFAVECENHFRPAGGTSAGLARAARIQRRSTSASTFSRTTRA